MKNMFKYASLLAAAAMLFACEGNVDTENTDDGTNPGDKLVLSADKKLIHTFDGDYAKITVTLGDKVITEDVMFFDEDKKVIEVPDFKFATTTPGEHQLIASYGTYLSDPITITAVNVKIPQTPADPKPGSTDFKARVFITQFTTTGCGPCANMKSSLHGAVEDATLADKVVLTTCHSGLINSVKDPAYIRTEYDEFCGAQGFPYVFCDMYDGFNNNIGGKHAVAEALNKYHANKDNTAGIAVNSSISGGQLVAKVTVKAAKAANYMIGAFLLEDGIYGKQTNASENWMHRHDGVIRYMDSQDYIGTSKHFYGRSVGKIETGKTADYVFVWDLAKIWDEGSKNGELYGGTVWGNFSNNEDAQTVKKGKTEFVAGKDLHLAVFVSTIGKDLKGKEIYLVNNVVDCPVNGETPYEYK